MLKYYYAIYKSENGNEELVDYDIDDLMTIADGLYYFTRKNKIQIEDYSDVYITEVRQIAIEINKFFSNYDNLPVAYEPFILGQYKVMKYVMDTDLEINK